MAKFVRRRAKACVSLRNWQNAGGWGKGFSLTVAHVASVIGNCAYCGCEPSVARKDNKGREYLVHGLDRINSDLGYIDGNVVSCCWRCNAAKNNMSVAEFQEWVASVVRHMGIVV